MRTRIFSGPLAKLLVWIAILVPAARGNEGVVAGLVQDSSGAPVAGAKVKLHSKETGEEWKTSTAATGHFEFRGRQAGVYVVTVSAPGFEQEVSTLRLRGPETPLLQFRLEVEEVKEQVTVSADSAAAPLATENLDAVGLSHSLLGDLPLSNGDPQAVVSMFLDPATVGAKGPAFIVDGMESDSLELPADSIKSVQVNRNPYSPEFGRPGKGRIEVNTRRGVHGRYRGGVSLLFQNSALDARNAFAAVKPVRQRAIPEAQLDGPLGKRTTFFLSARHDLNNENSLVNAQTPAGRRVENFGAPERDTFLFGRTDVRIHPAHKLTAQYKYKNVSVRNQGVGGFNLPQRGFDLFNQENQFRILETAVPSPRFINELRFSFKQERSSKAGQSMEPAIIVLDAFSSGGAQISQRLRERSASVQNIATFTRGVHTFRFGGSVKPKSFRSLEASNFGGTYSFPSLAAYLGQDPYLYARNLGNPEAGYRQDEGYSFAQDEIRARKDLSVVLGLRHELQSNLRRHMNLAPRTAFAWSPGGRQTVVRAGFGVFYDRQPDVMRRQELLYDGQRVRQVVLPDPPYPLPDGDSGLPLAKPSLVRLAPDRRLPYLLQSNVAVERKLGGSLLSVDYTFLRGVHLYRTRNVNAPLVGNRPDESLVNVNQFESSGSSRGHSLAFTLHTRAGRSLELLGQYTLSRTIDDTGGMFSLPADNYDLSAERGRADFDRRHRFNLIGTGKLPWDLRFSGIVNLWSGAPYNITTGFDDNHDTVANDRPPGLNRNAGDGPPLYRVDARLAKGFRFAEESPLRVKLAVDVFNLLNQVNDKTYVGTRTSPFFGRANAAGQARQIQASLRFSF